jgi:hypothetical protein
MSKIVNCLALIFIIFSFILIKLFSYIARKPLASQPRGFFTLASRLRASQEDFSLSQAACEPVKRIFHSRKPLASQSREFFTLASRLRAGQEGFSLSQAACEAHRRRATSFFSKIVVHNVSRLYIMLTSFQKKET